VLGVGSGHGSGFKIRMEILRMFSIFHVTRVKTSRDINKYAVIMFSAMFACYFDPLEDSWFYLDWDYVLIGDAFQYALCERTELNIPGAVCSLHLATCVPPSLWLTNTTEDLKDDFSDERNLILWTTNVKILCKSGKPSCGSRESSFESD